MESFHLQLQTATEHLSKSDKQIATLVKQYGPCLLEPHTDYYGELVSSIISQQLSVKAAATIYKRFLGLYGNELPTPAQIIQTDTEAIRTVGCSYSKAAYIKDLASKIEAGQLDLDNISKASNEEIIKELTAVKGIGEWSAHMFMIFSLGRLDILATGDLGIRKAVQLLYKLRSLPLPQDVAAISDKKGWAPYQSVVCWYLWKSLDNKPA